MKTEEEEASAQADAQGGDRGAQQSRGQAGAQERTGSSSDGIALLLLSVEGAWAHCPRPWYLRNIGQKGTGSK